MGDTGTQRLTHADVHPISGLMELSVFQLPAVRPIKFITQEIINANALLVSFGFNLNWFVETQLVLLVKCGMVMAASKFHVLRIHFIMVPNAYATQYEKTAILGNILMESNADTSKINAPKELLGKIINAYRTINPALKAIIKIKGHAIRSLSFALNPASMISTLYHVNVLQIRVLQALILIKIHACLTKNVLENKYFLLNSCNACVPTQLVLISMEKNVSFVQVIKYGRKQKEVKYVSVHQEPSKWVIAVKLFQIRLGAKTSQTQLGVTFKINAFAEMDIPVWVFNAYAMG